MGIYAVIHEGVIVSERDIPDFDSYPSHKKAAIDERGDGGPVLRPLVVEGDGPVKQRVIEMDRVRVILSHPEPQPITADDVRNEAQRRIIIATGARDLLHCMIRQSNANMRANELNDKRISGANLTDDELIEAEALRALAAVIKKIRLASNEMEANPPEDYQSDYRWEV